MYVYSTIALPGPGELIADKGGKDNHEFDIIIIDLVIPRLRTGKLVRDLSNVRDFFCLLF